MSGEHDDEVRARYRRDMERYEARQRRARWWIFGPAFAAMWITYPLTDDSAGWAWLAFLVVMVVMSIAMRRH